MSLALLCCECSRRLPENAPSVAPSHMSARVQQRAIGKQAAFLCSVFFYLLSMWYCVLGMWSKTAKSIEAVFVFFVHILLFLPHSVTHGQSLWAHLCSPRFIIYLTEGLAGGNWTAHKLSCRLQCDAKRFHSPGSLAYNLCASPSRSRSPIRVQNVKCN